MHRNAYDVIVAGGGAAGLAAAGSLAKHKRVLLLEARDRFGGRVHWTTVDGEQLQLGAEFIHGAAPETYALLRSANASWLQSGSGRSWRFTGKKLVEDIRAFEGSEKLLDDVDALADDETVDAYFARFAHQPALADTIATARMFVEGFDAADPSVASIRGIAAEWRSGVDDTAARIEQGYGALIERLVGDAAAAGAELVTASTIERITWNHAGVSMRTVDGTDYSARHAVITLPVSVLRERLRHEFFVPPLPESKTAAIAHLETGSVARVVMSFREPFWERVNGGAFADASFFRSPGTSFAAFWTQYPLRRHSIVAWAGGPRAKALLALGREALGARAVEEFGRLFGDSAQAQRHLHAISTHDWDADPFARGAYSYVRVHGVTARHDFAQPLAATLFFAGETTCGDGQGGTVNGAIASGYRAAGEVLAASTAEAEHGE